MSDNVKDITVPTDAGAFVNSERFAAAINAAVPRGLSGARLLRQMQTAVNRNEALRACSVLSLRDCFMDIAQLGLDLTPALGYVYLIPYGKVCTLIVGYRGLVELMYRTGKVKSVRAVPVFKGDKFEYRYGLHEDLVHEPCGNTNPEDLTHVYCVIKIEGTDPVWQVMTREQCERHRARSKSKNNGPWVTDYVPMCLKTVTRQTSKWAPMMAEVHDVMTMEDEKYPDYIPAEFTAAETTPAAASAPEAISGRLANRQGGKRQRKSPEATAHEAEARQGAGDTAPIQQEEERPANDAGDDRAQQEEDHGDDLEAEREAVKRQLKEEQGEEPQAQQDEKPAAPIGSKEHMVQELSGLIGRLPTAGQLVFRQKILKGKPLDSFPPDHLSIYIDAAHEELSKREAARGK